jgi:hypothetical protein
VIGLRYWSSRMFSCDACTEKCYWCVCVCWYEGVALQQCHSGRVQSCNLASDGMWAVAGGVAVVFSGRVCKGVGWERGEGELEHLS